MTKEVKPFDDTDIASHILQMVPRNWQDQYELTGATIPQSVCKLLEMLKRIEKAFPTDKECKVLTQVRREEVPPKKDGLFQ